MAEPEGYKLNLNRIGRNGQTRTISTASQQICSNLILRVSKIMTQILGTLEFSMSNEFLKIPFKKRFLSKRIKTYQIPERNSHKFPGVICCTCVSSHVFAFSIHSTLYIFGVLSWRMLVTSYPIHFIPKSLRIQVSSYEYELGTVKTTLQVFFSFFHFKPKLGNRFCIEKHSLSKKSF